MATGTSLLLIAVGAVLAIAVNYQAQGLDINAVGVILMIVGGIGLLMSLLFLASFAPFRTDHTVHDDVHDTHEHV
jgi:Domain of unknown function (DUF6458)